MRPLPACCLLVLVLLPLAGATTPREVRLTENGSGEERRIVLENNFVRIVIDPSLGGRIESFVHKSSGAELTAPLTETRPGGLLSDHVWQQDYAGGDWLRTPYAVQILEQSPQRIRVQLTSNPGRIWTGISFSKTLTLSADSSALAVEYAMSADEQVDPRAHPDFHFHQALAGKGKVFVPAEAGVTARPQSGEGESWVYDPTQGWAGYVAESGAGLAAVMQFERLRAFRVSQTPALTMEWILRKTDFPPGTSIATPVRLAAFSGLQHVSAAGERLAMQLDVDATEKSTARVIVAPFQDGPATLSVSIHPMNGGAEQPAATQTLKLIADRPTNLTVALPMKSDGSFVVRATIRAEGMLDVVAEQPILRGGAGAYAMRPQAQRIPEASDVPTWSRYHPKDLNFNSPAVSTPHRVWAKPYAAGRPRVLALMPDGHDRQAVELAQRFDLDLTCAFLCDSTYYVIGDRVRSLKMEAVHANLERTLEQSFDVIVLSHDAWGRLTDKARARLMEQVEGGTGLVFLQRGDAPAQLKPYVPMTHLGYDWTSGRWELLPDTPPILRGLPYDAMPPTYHSNGSKLAVDELGEPLGTILLRAVRPQASGALIAIGQVGKGRLVQSFTEGPLIPSIGKIYGRSVVPLKYDAERVVPFDYWEYHYAVIARLMYWAARMEPPVVLLDINGDERRVEVSFQSSSSGPAKLRLVLRDLFGQTLHEIEQPIALEAGKGTTRSIDVPAQIAGACHLADVSIHNEQGVLAFGAGSFAPRDVRIATAAPAQEIYQPGDSATVVAQITGTPPAGSVVRGDLYDGSGRLVARADAPAQPQTSLSLSLSGVIGPVYDVRLALLSGERVIGQSWCQGRIKAVRQPERYRTAFWAGVGGAAPMNVLLETHKYFQEMGITANWASAGPMSFDALVLQRLNMPYSRGATGMAANGGVTKQQAAEKPDWTGCLHSPKVIQDKRDSGARNAQAHADEDVLIYSCGDENRGPVKDICFCADSTRAFRQWLAKEYESIGQLNLEWGTQYASFDQVEAMTEDEVKQHAKVARSYGPWLDQRNFNKWSYAQMARAAVEGVHQFDPGAPVGASGTQESAVYGGRDWWHLARAYNALSAYGGLQTVEQESYAPDMIRYSWAGYSKPNPLNRVSFYNRLCNYDRGIAIFASRSHVNPDFTLSEAGKDIRAVLLELQQGIGQLLVSAKVPPDPVYILQSPSSIAGSYITGHDGMAQSGRSATVALMEHLGIRYRSISYEQLAEGELSRLPARVLILPWSVALSARQAKHVEQWVAAGGTLIADMQTGTMSDHGRLLETPLLDNVLGIDRSRAALAIAAANQSWPAHPTNTSAHALEVGGVETDIRLAGAQPLWVLHQDGQEISVVLHHIFGKGHAYYLAADLLGAYKSADAKPEDAQSPARISLLQQTIDAIFAQAGVQPHATVHLRDADGKLSHRAPWVWTKMKTLGGARIVVLMRDYTTLSAPLPDYRATIKFREPGVIYDVVARRLLGRGDSVDLTLTNFTGRVFAILPAPVLQVKLQSPPDSCKPGQMLSLDCEIVSADGSNDPHVVRVDVTRPDGTHHRIYSGDLIFPGAGGTVRIPFALNDQTGVWRLRVCDVASGVTTETEIKVQ